MTLKQNCGEESLPAAGFSWEDISASVIRSEVEASPWGAAEEEAASRARTWLLRSRGFGELDVATETLP